MGISVTVVKSGADTSSYVKKLNKMFRSGFFEKYGELGVQALSESTPNTTTGTKYMWRYEIIYKKDDVKIWFYNDDLERGKMAIILQYGHMSKNGTWVEGRDYINPATQVVFDQMVEDIWKEVCS